MSFVLEISFSTNSLLPTLLDTVIDVLLLNDVSEKKLDVCEDENVDPIEKKKKTDHETPPSGVNKARPECFGTRLRLFAFLFHGMSFFLKIFFCKIFVPHLSNSKTDVFVLNDVSEKNYNVSEEENVDQIHTQKEVDEKTSRSVVDESREEHFGKRYNDHFFNNLSFLKNIAFPKSVFFFVFVKYNN